MQEQYKEDEWVQVNEQILTFKFPRKRQGEYGGSYYEFDVAKVDVHENEVLNIQIHRYYGETLSLGLGDLFLIEKLIPLLESKGYIKSSFHKESTVEAKQKEAKP